MSFAKPSVSALARFMRSSWKTSRPSERSGRTVVSTLHYVNFAQLIWTGNSLAPCMPDRLACFIIDSILGLKCVALRPALENSLFSSCRHVVGSYRSNGSEPRDKYLRINDLYTLFAFSIDIRAQPIRHPVPNLRTDKDLLRSASSPSPIVPTAMPMAVSRFVSSKTHGVLCQLLSVAHLSIASWCGLVHLVGPSHSGLGSWDRAIL